MAKTSGTEAEFSFKSLVNGAKEAKIEINMLKNKIAQLYSVLKTTYIAVSKLTDYTDKYITSSRLLSNALGENTKQAQKLVNSLTEMTGLDETTLTNRIALFGQLATSLGVAGDNASTLAENLTITATKLAMLYNYDFDEMSQMLQNAVQGKGTSLASNTGILVNQKTMTNTLSTLGIDATVSSLNTAETAILRYLTIQQQLNNTEEEYGEIVNTVAWQKQMLTAQVIRLKTALGNALYPVLQKLLPVFNAILMVVTELINMFAVFLGFDMSDVTTSVSTGASAWDDYASSVQSATTQLRGFDKLNNIKTPSSSSSSNSLGINQGLLDALDETNEKMLNITNKATEIRDKIMEWLGFQKYINSETGEITWKLGDGYTNIEKIRDAIGIILTTVATYKVLTYLADVADILGGSSGKSSKTILGGIINIGEMIGNVFGVEGLSTLANFGIGLGTIVTTVGLIYGTCKLISEIHFDNIQQGVDWWTGASEETSTRIGNVETNVEELQALIDRFSYSGMKMSDEDYDTILSTIIELKNSSLTELDDWYTSELTKLDTMYSDEDAKATESYKLAKENLQTKYNDQKAILDEYITEYQEAYKKAYDDDKTISNDERLELLEIQKKIQQWSIDSLSSSIEEKEALTTSYLNNEKAQYYKAQVEELEEQKKNEQEKLKSAQETYDKQLAYAKTHYEEDSTEYANYVAKIEQERQKAVDNATDEYDTFYNGWKEANSDIADYVDKETGTIFSNMLEDFGDLDQAVSAIAGTAEGTVDASTASIVNFYKDMGNTVRTQMAYLEYLNSDAGKKSADAFAKAFGKELSTYKYSLNVNAGTTDTVTSGSFNYNTGTITAKADGGFLNKGDLFFANEAGPELVGTLGGKTAVANNGQIEAGIEEASFQGFMRALKANGGTKSKTVIEATGDTSGLLQFIKFQEKENDRQFGL